MSYCTRGKTAVAWGYVACKRLTDSLHENMDGIMVFMAGYPTLSNQTPEDLCIMYCDWLKHVIGHKAMIRHAFVKLHVNVEMKEVLISRKRETYL